MATLAENKKLQSSGSSSTVACLLGLGRGSGTAARTEEAREEAFLFGRLCRLREVDNCISNISDGIYFPLSTCGLGLLGVFAGDEGVLGTDFEAGVAGLSAARCHGQIIPGNETILSFIKDH